MAFRNVINTIIFVFFFTSIKTTSCVVQVEVSKPTITFGGTINSYLPSCYGVDLEFFLQISTSNYSSQSTYFIQQLDAKSYLVDLTNSTSFQITTPTDFISITGILSMRCSTSPSPFSDSFLIQSQSSGQPDRNNINVPIAVTSAINQWALATTITRKCTGAGQYGFNCNEQCTDTDDAYSCYTCGNAGQKVCCNNAGDVNQDDCSYYDRPPSSTLSPSVQCSSTAENTYFWLMISFAIIIAILAIFLLLTLLELCCGCFTAHRARKGSEKSEEDWVVENEPRANRQLYDGDVSRHHQTRRPNEGSRDSTESDENHRPPFVVNRQGLENRVYDDDSLRQEWLEPQPRKIARV